MEIQTVDVIHPASTVEDIALTATLPSEMVGSQKLLIEWCEKKIALVKAESMELFDAYERARKMKWKDKPLHDLHVAAVKRWEYYEKVKAALLEGYYIVPNFQIDMFAIRTNKKNAKGSSTYYYSTHQQSAQELPIGEAEYKNPFPLIERHKSRDEKGNREDLSVAVGWDEMEFPITMAKPNIMEATSRAMALKIFDEIGIVPHNRKEDPIIIGRIKSGKGTKRKAVSFMIAWHLDTRMI